MISTHFHNLQATENLKFKFRITKLNLCILIFCFVLISFLILFLASKRKYLRRREKLRASAQEKMHRLTVVSLFVCIFFVHVMLTGFRYHLTVLMPRCASIVFSLWKVCALHICSRERISVFSNEIFMRKIISSKTCIIHSPEMKQHNSISMTMQCEFVSTARCSYRSWQFK